jgi:hypothetical protein
VRLKGIVIWFFPNIFHTYISTLILTGEDDAKSPDGRIIAGAGSVFSYYEFKQPQSNRLTDEEWKQMLEEGQQPDRPTWTSSFVSE